MSRAFQTETCAGGQAPTITELMDKPILQALQCQFSHRHRLPTAIMDLEGEPITYERRHCKYCREIRRTMTGFDLCRRADRKLIKEVCRTGKPSGHVCPHGGLYDFAVPIRVNNKIAACFFIGQIRLTEHDSCSTFLQELRAAHHGRERSKIALPVLEQYFADRRPKSPKQLDRLCIAAVEFANRLGVALSKLRGWNRPKAVAKFVAKIAQANDFRSLFDVCVREIPTLLGTKHCSVLTVVQGRTGEEPRLVLQRTSYQPSRYKEGMDFYLKGEGLTGWVWKNQRALRLHDITDESERARHPGLNWVHKFDDSDHHKEWMGVPLFGWRGDVIGVVRVPEKSKRNRRAGGGGFDFEDEVLLTSVGRHVAHRMEELRAREHVQTAIRACQQCAVGLSKADTREQVAAVVISACVEIFGRDGKACFFNQLSDDRKSLTAIGVGGALINKNNRGMVLPAEGSLSGLCLRRKRAVLIHDLVNAQDNGEYFPAVRGLEQGCGMSVPIVSGETQYGALSLGANRRFEFSEEPDLRVLKDLASIAGSSLARIDAQERIETAAKQRTRDVGHMITGRVSQLKKSIAELKVQAPRDLRSMLKDLAARVHSLNHAAAIALRHGEVFKQRFFDVSAALFRLRTMYPDPRISWTVPKQIFGEGDPELIVEAVAQLLDNALRFVPPKGGRISICLSDRMFPPSRGYGKDTIVIRVKDNGPGVPMLEKEAIFSRAPRSASDEHFGIGLRLVKSVAEAHGGRAKECGRERAGAEFVMVLPIRRDHEKTTIEQARRRCTSAARGRRR